MNGSIQPDLSLSPASFELLAGDLIQRKRKASRGTMTVRSRGGSRETGVAIVALDATLP